MNAEPLAWRDLSDREKLELRARRARASAEWRARNLSVEFTKARLARERAIADVARLGFTDPAMAEAVANLKRTQAWMAAARLDIDEAERV